MSSEIDADTPRSASPLRECMSPGFALLMATSMWIVGTFLVDGVGLVLSYLTGRAWISGGQAFYYVALSGVPAFGVLLGVPAWFYWKGDVKSARLAGLGLLGVVITQAVCWQVLSNLSQRAHLAGLQRCYELRCDVHEVAHWAAQVRTAHAAKERALLGLGVPSPFKALPSGAFTDVMWAHLETNEVDEVTAMWGSGRSGMWGITACIAQKDPPATVTNRPVEVRVFGGF